MSIIVLMGYVNSLAPYLMCNLKCIPILQTLLDYIKILLKMYFYELFPAIFNNSIQFVQQNVYEKQIKYVTFESLKILFNCCTCNYEILIINYDIINCKQITIYYLVFKLLLKIIL